MTTQRKAPKKKWTVVDDVYVIEELMNRKQNKLKRLIEFNKVVCLSSSLIPGKKLVIE